MIVPMLAVIAGSLLMLVFGVLAMGTLDPEPCENFARERPPQPALTELCLGALDWTGNIYSTFAYLLVALPSITIVMAAWMWRQ